MSDEEERVMLVQRVEEEEKKSEELVKRTNQNQKPTMLVQRKPNNDPNRRKFLILFVGYDENDDVITEWSIQIGRQACYDSITSMMENDYCKIDLVESRIVAETETINQAKSLYKYMEHIIENELIPLKDGEYYPDIDEYMTGDIDDYAYQDGLPSIVE